MGSEIACGIGIGKNVTRKEFERRSLDSCEQNEITMQAKAG